MQTKIFLYASCEQKFLLMRKFATNFININSNLGYFLNFIGVDIYWRFLPTITIVHVQYILSRDGAGSKWLPVHKVQEQLHEKQGRGVQKAYKLHPLATLLQNLLYNFR